MTESRLCEMMMTTVGESFSGAMGMMIVPWDLLYMTRKWSAGGHHRCTRGNLDLTRPIEIVPWRCDVMSRGQRECFRSLPGVYSLERTAET